MSAKPYTFAGDHMRLTVDDAGTGHIEFSDKSLTGRVCGSCTLCCKLVPVAEFNKPAGKRCQHAKHGKGCSIYATRPTSCRSWACRWLVDDETAGMPRPDRCHYVIDLMGDTVLCKPDDGSAAFELRVIQVWVDPAFPEAAKSPELRAYMLMVAEKHQAATIVRWDSERAYTIFPPPLTHNGAWQEKSGEIVARNELERRILDMAAGRNA